MTEPVTLVTAYFDIGRASFAAVPRTEQRYFDEFRFWARIQNPLVVFVEPRCVEQVLAIRAEFGLEDITTVVPIEDMYAIEPEVYARMVEAAGRQEFKDLRLMPEATSGIAAYSYLMLLKSWFIKEAVERGLTGESVAWIDFSYNRGGRIFSDPAEFAFVWRSEPFEKITLFAMDEVDERPAFEVVRRLSDCIMGSIFVLPSRLGAVLWECNLAQMKSMLDLGLIDDDQTVLLMSARKFPEYFTVVRSDWFRPIEDLTGRTFRRTPTPERGLLLSTARRGLHWGRRQRRAAKNAWTLYRNLARDTRR